MCTSVLLPPPALPPQATTSTLTTTRTTTAARAFFMAYSSPLGKEASPLSLGNCLPMRSALLHRQRPDHVALGCHGTFKAARACPAGSEALEEVGAGFARVEGEADGIRLLAISGKWDIDVQLRDREGVCDFGWGQ